MAATDSVTRTVTTIFSWKKLTTFLSRCMECRRGLAMRLLSVRPSVSPSVCQARALWQNGRKTVQIFIPRERSFSLLFGEEEWWVGATPYIWNFGSTGPRWSEIADFEPIIARSASAVRPSEESSIHTNRKSPTRFPTSLRWSPYVAPKSPKWGLKNAKRPFFLFAWRKSATKFLCVKNCQRQSCRAFIDQTIHAKIIGGDVPFYLKFWVKVAALERNRRFLIYFRS